jgi:hypothetical protein
MVMNPSGLGPEEDFSGEAQQELYDPSSRQRGRCIITSLQLSTHNFKEKEKKNCSRFPDGGLTPRQTGRLTVGRKMA